MKMEFIPAKSILQKANYGKEWFGVDYNVNLYKGCPHQCIYCDSRSNCYQIEDFDRVRGKQNELEILEQELRKKRKKGVIGIGAMSDTYHPLEKQYEITRKALELMEKYQFGVSIETKSDLIVRDMDLFQKINRTQNVILKFSITTADDLLASKIEPGVCVSSQRFQAMRELADNGLFVGTLLTPILPFLTDSDKNIRQIIRLSAENGAKFVFSMGGVTLRENQREYFLEKLEELFPGLKEIYVRNFGNQYFCYSLNSNLKNVLEEECKKYGLLYQMEDIIEAYQKKNEMEQLSWL